MRRSLSKGLHRLFLHMQVYPLKLYNEKFIANISTYNNVNHINKIPEHVESWSTLISTIAQARASGKELALYKASKLLNSSNIQPTGYDLVHLVRASTDLGLDSYCRQLHCYILKSGFGADVSVSTTLLRFFKVKESVNEAHNLFVEMPQPNVVSWNTLISTYVQSGQFRTALGLLVQLDGSGICPDAYSFTVALSACGQLSLLHLGSSIHCKIVKFGMECGVFVGNCLIDMYGKCGSVEEAVRVFDELIDKDIISWNSIIVASARNGNLELANNFFYQMPERDVISYNEMINGIAQFGNIEDAIEMLLNMPNPNSSSWNSIITACVNRNQAREALEIFTKMHNNDFKKDEYTYSVLLSGVAGLAALKWGMLIHCCTIKGGFATSVVVGSALIDMYSKCGQVKNAELVFRLLDERNLITWNAMISGYAHNGDSNKVIQQFEEMRTVEGLNPDDVTFLNVISAISNTEAPLQKGIQYFELMINDYGIKPTVEHCCSMIRLMGQRGDVDQAKRMIYELAFGSYGTVWRALLGACGTCRNLKVARIAAAKVIELEGDDEYVYVMMSNIFASYGKWNEVGKVRRIMWGKEVRKEVGCSWIEVET
ncbi:putative pentatricopeptide repeat-containing protein At5g47460 [Mercurialis annua]|uniref:putative pentatricopeptide repeat-containing protein At5g47460 n=1 Tax=Mercurialis annua TaxID=3986 RepID=UPI00215EF159|nr:putative pentatricopeptide repeat-containing protein At5g47460 [Mercurialis annua]